VHKGRGGLGVEIRWRDGSAVGLVAGVCQRVGIKSVDCL